MDGHKIVDRKSMFNLKPLSDKHVRLYEFSKG